VHLVLHLECVDLVIVKLVCAIHQVKTVFCASTVFFHYILVVHSANMPKIAQNFLIFKFSQLNKFTNELIKNIF